MAGRHTEFVDPLILTARLDEESQSYFDELRRRYFPPERNFIAAHVTLFHALPQEKLSRITAQLEEVTRCEAPMEGSAYKLQSLGRGVAFVVDCARLVAVRRALAEAWHEDLTPQDKQKSRLHITVQNKVSADEARCLLDELNCNFKTRPLVFTGLDVWKYLEGPWSYAAGFAFRGGAE